MSDARGIKSGGATGGSIAGKVAPFVILGLAVIVIPLLQRGGVISIEAVNQLGRFMCFGIVALGIDLIWGYTGILSLCQAMFFCLGGYAIGMHMALHGPLDGEGIPRCLFVVTSEVSGFKLPWFWEPFKTLPVAMLLVVLVPGIVAFIFGYFAFRSRVRGVYFSIITQATTLGACLVFRRNEMRLCGTNGLTNFETLAGFDVRTPEVKLGLYILTTLVLAAVYLGCKYLVASRLGRILIAIRDNESRLRFSGYQPLYFKCFAFTLAAVIAAIGGMLYTPQTGIMTPFNMEPEKSIFLVVLVAAGGRASLSGAVLGAIVVNYAMAFFTSGTIYNAIFTPKLPEQMNFIEKVIQFVFGPKGWPFTLGGLYIAVVLYFPDGMIAAWHWLTGASKESHAASAGPPASAKPPSGSSDSDSAPALKEVQA